MAWIDPWGNRHEQLPERIRLADFTTRTADAATAEAAINGGWTQIEMNPAPEPEPSPEPSAE